MDRQTITVDIAPEGYADHRLKVSQYDVGRPLGVYIKQDGADLGCAGYTAQLYLYKPDRTNIEKPCTISNNLITWDTAEQETIMAGICVAEIRIRDGSRDVGTANFTIWVEESPADTSGSSHSESQSLIDMVDRAEDAAETAESSAAIAVHAKDETVAAAETVERFDQMTAEAETLAPGSEATAEMDYSGEHPVMKFGIPAGATGPEGRQGQQGQQGIPGVSPVISVSDITGGHRVTITDAEGTHTFDVMDGGKGDPGQTGQTGPAGYSPTVTVTDITDGHRVTITDQQGQHPFDVMDGEDSAVLSVNGETGAVVLDGTKVNVNNSASDPETVEDAFGRVNNALNALEPAATSGDVGKFLKAKTVSDGKVTEYEFGEGGGGISDVQVNGTSVVSGGVANVPIANNSRYGVVRTDADYGTQELNNRIAVVKAADDQCGIGTHTYRAIVPFNQHLATFYGLAKAAGDSTQSASANAVGTYTEEAKQKIKDMLGIGDWFKLWDDTTTEDLSTYTISTDSNGNPFVLKDAIIYMTAQNGSQQTVYANIYNTNGSYTQFSLGNIINTGIVRTVLRIEQIVDKFIVSLNTPRNDFRAIDQSQMLTYCGLINITPPANITQIKFSATSIPAGTQIIVYGKKA